MANSTIDRGESQGIWAAVMAVPDTEGLRMIEELSGIGRELAAATITRGYVRGLMRPPTSLHLLRIYRMAKERIHIGQGVDQIAYILVSSLILDQVRRNSGLESPRERERSVETALAAISDRLPPVRWKVSEELVGSITVADREGVTLLAQSYHAILSDLAAAFLASAYLEGTARVEGSTEMVEVWAMMRRLLAGADEATLASAILLMGRFGDVRETLLMSEVEELPDTLGRLRRLTIALFPEGNLPNGPVQWAVPSFLASGEIALSPGVEGLRRMAERWKEWYCTLGPAKEWGLPHILSAVICNGYIQTLSPQVDVVAAVAPVFRNLSEELSGDP